MAQKERLNALMKILLTDGCTLICNNDLSLDVFEKYGDLFVFQNISRDELLKEIVDTDVVLCNKTIIDKEIFEKAKKLKYIGTFATGYNNIDIAVANEKGVTVCNAPDYSTNAVAQQVITYMLMHYTKVNQYNNFVKDNGWLNSTTFSPLVFSTDEVAGKTLGIVGFGSIGMAVAKIAIALGMNVLVYTRTKKDYENIAFVSFEELLSKSDVVTLHCPLTDKTADLMNSESFSKMKNGAFFINTSRGGTVDEDALFDALSSGKLSGAAVDVLKQEPMSKDCVLLKAPNIIITPHSAWAPLTTRKRLLKLVEDNLNMYLNGKPQNFVN